jgi:hypothetical protein
MRVLAVCPDITDATCLYRGLGPLSMLHKMRHIELTTPVKAVSYYDLRMNEVLFLQRPWGSRFKDIMSMALDAGIPVWVDYDDAIDCIPVHSPAYWTYQEWEPDLRYFLEHANLVTVSTQGIKDRWKKYTNKIHVVDNALDDRWLKYKSSSPRVNRMTWRGSNTHEFDVSSNMKYFQHILEDAKIEKRFLGCAPSCIYGAKNVTRVAFQSASDPESFIKKLCTLNAKVHIVPLENSPFNKCKSNISWIEGTLAGSQVFASKIGVEWDKPGIGNLETFTGAEVETSFEYIMEHLLLSNKNLSRLKLMSEII